MLLALLAAAAGLGMAPQSTNPGMWLRAPEYARDGLGRLDTPGVRIEMTVDENGDPVSCNIIASSGTKALDDIFCLVPMRRAHFKPARDENGQPITSVFSTNFYSRFDQHSHGPAWTDYTLTVSKLPAIPHPVTVVRIVTDAAGHVESCTLETPSGADQLDRLACSYTRSNVVLAAPLDRNGRAVRALRLTSIGFAAGGARGE